MLQGFRSLGVWGLGARILESMRRWVDDIQVLGLIARLENSGLKGH